MKTHRIKPFRTPRTGHSPTAPPASHSDGHHSPPFSPLFLHSHRPCSRQIESRPLRSQHTLYYPKRLGFPQSTQCSGESLQLHRSILWPENLKHRLRAQSNPARFQFPTTHWVSLSGNWTTLWAQRALSPKQLPSWPNPTSNRWLPEAWDPRPPKQPFLRPSSLWIILLSQASSPWTLFQ